MDDFEAVKTTPWEGVRNAEARNLMKEMKVGDKVSLPRRPFCEEHCRDDRSHRRYCSTTLIARTQVRIYSITPFSPVHAHSTCLRDSGIRRGMSVVVNQRGLMARNTSRCRRKHTQIVSSLVPDD